MWGLPPALRRGVAAAARAPRVRRVFAMLVTPVGAWLLHLFVLWGWHAPGAFDAAMAGGAMHWLQHVSFFVAAFIFWYSVLAPGRAPRESAPAVISLFATAVQTTLLGVLLTFSGSVWYHAYAAGGQMVLTPLEDQQLGGLIMWIPGGIVFVAAALAIIGRWLTAPDRAALHGEKV